MAAEKVLVDADMRRKKRKQVIDMMAAVVILQNYLDSKSFKIWQKLPKYYKIM